MADKLLDQGFAVDGTSFYFYARVPKHRLFSLAHRWSGVVFFYCLLTIFLLRLASIRKAFAPLDNGVFVGEHQFHFDEEGIKTKGIGYEASHRWSVVKRIERANGMILIYLDTACAYVFPENKLEDPSRLFNYLNEEYKKI